MPDPIEYTSDNGFAIPNPLEYRYDLYGETGLFTDAGIHDHGAHFDFNLRTLAPGETKTFYLYSSLLSVPRQGRRRD
jgi:hypothetical protein